VALEVIRPFFKEESSWRSTKPLGEGRMAGRITKHPVQLNRKPRKRLEILVRRRSRQHWMVQRARIVLLSAEGLEVHEIGARLSIDRQVLRSAASCARCRSSRTGVGTGSIQAIQISTRKPPKSASTAKVASPSSPTTSAHAPATLRLSDSLVTRVFGALSRPSTVAG